MTGRLLNTLWFILGTILGFVLFALLFQATTTAATLRFIYEGF